MYRELRAQYDHQCEACYRLCMGPDPDVEELKSQPQFQQGVFEISVLNMRKGLQSGGCPLCRAFLRGIETLIEAPRWNTESLEGYETWKNNWLASIRGQTQVPELLLTCEVSPKLQHPFEKSKWSIKCRRGHDCESLCGSNHRFDIDIFSLPDTPRAFRNLPVADFRLIHNSDLRSKETIEFAQQCLERCETLHIECNVGQNKQLPGRLIDLEDNGARLRDSSSIPIEEGKYACLTHRWASIKDDDDDAYSVAAHARSLQCRTVQSNVEQRKDHIDIEDLISAFQDAITVTRALDIRFLWIDSLCIVQDDDNDKRVEIARMGKIYANAYVTITADNPWDHTLPFLLQRDWNWKAHKEVIQDSKGNLFDLYFRERPMHYRVSWGGIYQRAWCFQERLLSPRILRFQHEELVFECNEGLCCECGNPPAARDINPNELLDYDKVDFTRSIQSATTQLSAEHVRVWHRLVEEYSLTALSFETDRMDAIAGIAERISGGNEYVAGMWRHTLLENMLWFSSELPTRISEIPSRVAPSWSWLSMPIPFCPISFTRGSIAKVYPEIKKVSYQLASSTSPFGDIDGGAYVELNGSLISGKALGKRISIAGFHFGRLEESPQNREAFVSWDPMRKPPRNTEEPVFCLHMAHTNTANGSRFEVFLLLRQLKELHRHSETIPCYVRAGYMDVRRFGQGWTDQLRGVQFTNPFTHFRLC